MSENYSKSIILQNCDQSELRLFQFTVFSACNFVQCVQFVIVILDRSKCRSILENQPLWRDFQTMCCVKVKTYDTRLTNKVFKVPPFNFAFNGFWMGTRGRHFCMGGDSNHKVLGYGIMQFRHLLRNAVKVSLVVLWFPLSWANDGNYFFKWVLDHISMWSRKQLFHDGCSVLTLWWRSKSESRWGSISNHGEATEDHRAFWRKLGSKPEKIRQNTWFENYPKYLIRIFSLFLIRNSSRKMTIIWNPI